MLKFYYNPFYKYTNRTILDISSDTHYKDIDYENIDTPDTINGHIIYTLDPGERIPTYVVENNTTGFNDEFGTVEDNGDLPF